MGRSGAVPAIADAAIPDLARLASASEAARLLETILPAGRPVYGAEWLEIREVAVLRDHPGSRWTLRYDVRRPGGGESTIFAKIYARDRGDVATLLSTLRRNGLGHGRCMQASAPIAYLPTLRLLLLEQAPGEPARAALRHGQGGVGERTARWLAAFHAAPLPAAYLMHDPMIRARRWTQRLAAEAPGLGREAHHLLLMLAAGQPAWPPASPRLVHGDFGASHVYLSPETTTVIDWDAWGVGDAAEDAGRFIASLHHLASRLPERRDAVAREALAFSQAYRRVLPAAWRNLAFYEALAYLRKAARLAKHRDQGRLRRARTLLSAGAGALKHGHDGDRAA